MALSTPLYPTATWHSPQNGQMPEDWPLRQDVQASPAVKPVATPRQAPTPRTRIGSERSGRIPWDDGYPLKALRGPVPRALPQSASKAPVVPDFAMTDDEFPRDSARAMSADPRVLHAQAQSRHTLAQYNDAISQVRDDINAAMTVPERHAARTLNVLGVAGAIAGGVMMGLFAATALAGIASGIGAPVGALAAAAGVLTFLGGLVLTVLVSAMTRAIMRRSVQSVPGLDDKIESLQCMRRDLRDLTRRTPAEKALLRNIDVVLGKIEEANNHVASQTKTMFKTLGFFGTGGVMSLFAGYELATSKDFDRPITGGRTLTRTGRGDIRLPEGHAQLMRLVKKMPDGV